MKIRKGSLLKFNSKGMYPDLDNRYYRVMGYYKNNKDILNIQEVDPKTRQDLPKEHTQVIIKFKEGYNKYITQVIGL